MAKLGDVVEVEKIVDFLNSERKAAWEDVEAQPGDLDWEIAVGKIDIINHISKMLQNSNGAARSDMDEAVAPVWKSGESVVHYDYADGSAKTKIQQWAAWLCPKCGGFVGEQFVPSWAKEKPHNQNQCLFCPRCGQRIDWEKAEKRK